MQGSLSLRLGGAIAAVALSLSGLLAAPAHAQPTDAHGRPHCEPNTKYKLYKDGWAWHAFDSGTVVNKSKKATLHKTITHSSNESKTTTKSAEIGLSVKVWVAEINGKFGYSVSKQVSYTKTTSFTVDVPPKTKVKYKDGIIVRKFNVRKTRVFDNCNTKVTWGKIRAADNRSEVKDA